jgi:hypothetical protein
VRARLVCLQSLLIIGTHRPAAEGMDQCHLRIFMILLLHPLGIINVMAVSSDAAKLDEDPVPPLILLRRAHAPELEEEVSRHSFVCFGG